MSARPLAYSSNSEGVRSPCDTNNDSDKNSTRIFTGYNQFSNNSDNQPKYYPGQYTHKNLLSLCAYETGNLKSNFFFIFIFSVEIYL